MYFTVWLVLIISNQPILKDSARFIFLDLFQALKKQTVEQRAPNTATIRRAKVVFSPVSAFVMDSSMPRNITVSVPVTGALVPAEKGSEVITADRNIPEI